MRREARLLVVLAATSPFGCAAAPPAAAATTVGPPVEVTLDASTAPGRLLHAHLVIPAHPGPLTLQYPRWIPGEHAPSGPIVNLSGLRMSAAGKPVDWRRDDERIYEFHLTVPAGAHAVEVDLDYLEPSSNGSFSAGISATASLVDLSWNQVILYPKGASPAALTYVARLRLPPGWKHGTALPEVGESGGVIEFRPVSLETLIDSPVVAGAHLRTIPLSQTDGAATFIDAVADSEEALQMTPQQLAAYKQLVAEAEALFGARHYRDYHFLYTLSDQVSSFGLEHHESSDNRVGERTLLDDDPRRGWAGLLPHEYAHSWNGKYRRPRGLATKDYQDPMQGDLLWVYEGLTEYLGWVLTGRSGLLSVDEELETVALYAASLDQEPGRAWRSLEDTAVAAQVLYGAPSSWSSMRRGVDFYSEGLLIWLEADVTIRQKTQGQRSLDDFCHRFHGGTSGAPEVKPYDLDEIVRTLNDVAPNDWRGFFDTRVHRVLARAPMGGITAGGYRLTWSEEPNLVRKEWDSADKVSSVAVFSLGLRLSDKGHVTDVVGDMPAARAGVVPDMQILAIDGRRFSSEVLHAALARGKSGVPLELIVEQGDFVRTLKLDAKVGERHPHLTRDGSTEDVLARILAARTPRPPEAVLAAPRKD